MANQAKESSSLFPQESLIRELTGHPRLSIGIPKENGQVETRLALTPEGIEIISEEKHSIYVESGAGTPVAYSDMQYSEAGAYIVNNKADVYGADIVMKISPPTPQELEQMHDRSTIFSTLQLSNLSREAIQVMMRKKMNVFAYELIKDDQGGFPIINTIAEIEGNTAIAVISDLMSNERGGKGILLGGVAGISPPEIVILGASMTGAVAARAALGLGAMVKIFDHDINKLRKIQQDLGRQIFTSVIHPNVLFKALSSADAVIGNLRYIHGSEPFMVSDELVKTMKKGAIIVDLSVDQGGCFETSECRTLSNPVFDKFGIIHYCVPNISARVGRTSSMAISNVMTPLVLKLGESGSLRHAVLENIGLRHGAYVYNGVMVNHLIGEYYDVPSHEIGLFLAGY